MRAAKSGIANIIGRQEWNGFLERSSTEKWKKTENGGRVDS